MKLTEDIATFQNESNLSSLFELDMLSNFEHSESLSRLASEARSDSFSRIFSSIFKKFFNSNY